MPRYRRRRFGRRFRRRRYTRRAPGWKAQLWSLAKKAALGTIKYYVNTERKWYDPSATSTTVDTSGVVSNLSSIDQGVMHSQRVGTQVKVMSIGLRGQMIGNSSATTDACVRFVIVQDRDGRGTPPTLAEVFESNTDPRSFLNMENRKRFVVLADRRFMVSPTAANPSSDVQFSIFKKCMIRVVYDSDDATNAPVANGIYCLAFSDEATNAPTIKYQARVRYIDN